MSIEEDVRARLLTDAGYYAENCLKIVGPGGKIMPLTPRTGQQRLYDALERQRMEGKPMRAIILKARKLGISTSMQGLLVQRATQQANHKALVVAHEAKSAGELFDIGELMYRNLPVDIQPKLVYRRKSATGLRYLEFGEPAELSRMKGLIGLNSSLHVDTAGNVQSGRGFTFRSMHVSEAAFFADGMKLVALLNAVPYEPDTLVGIESTANGHNHFKERWDRAVAGESSYAPVFLPWHEEPGYAIQFDTADEREAFVSMIGTGPFGEDEPGLIDRFGCTAEQLAWRRRVIADSCDSKVELFKQEFPASPDEAFIATGRQVFSMVLVNRVMDRVASIDPVEGVLRETVTKTRMLRTGTIEVPTGAQFVKRAATGFPASHPWWRVFASPEPGGEREGKKVPRGQYIVAADVASGEENTRGDTAFHALQVIDHRTGMQMAEWKSRCDPDLFALELVLAGLLYNEAWIVVEITGPGIAIAKKVWRDYGYRFIYRRRQEDTGKDVRPTERLGWDTNRRTKPQLEAGMSELLREGTDGIQGVLTARELLTYVKLPDGSSGPEDGSFSDLLMAWMIAHHVRRELPVRHHRPGGGVIDTRVVKR